MLTKTKGTLRIGTSNVVVPGNRLTFPENFKDKSRLSYYASLFNTVEVNSTFRRLPRLSTFSKWCDEVPDNFKFTLKLLKDFTHVKKLEVETGNLEAFINAANAIGQKKGCLLVQFPASITADYIETVNEILETLHLLDHQNQWQTAVELRSLTWYTNETYRMLAHYKASLVLQDMPKSNGLYIKQAFPFYYYRYHGPKGDYRDSYTEDFLQEQAQNIRVHLTQGFDVYAYFNNTMGNAFENATRLKALLE